MSPPVASAADAQDAASMRSESAVCWKPMSRSTPAMRITRSVSTEMIAPIFCSTLMRSMISGSIAAFDSSVMPSARTAVRSSCSVAPTLGYGRAILVPCRRRGARRWMPPSRFSTTAPNCRRMSRWKLIGRSPIRQPPRSGMNASPSRCSSGPQNRIGMRLAPACASMSATWALSTSVGSSAMTPAASSEVTRTPCSSRSSRTTATSRIRGTLCSSIGPSPSSDATIALETKFLAPRTVISPCRGAPPWICMTSRMGPSSLTDGVRVTRSAPAGRRGLGSRVRATTYREPSGHDWSGCLDRHIGQVLGRKGAWPPRCPVGLELGDLVGVLQGQADVVEALHQAPAGVVVHLQRHDDVDAAHLLGRQVDGHLGARRRLEDLPDQLDVLLGELGGQKPLLAGVAAEDVGEPRGEHRTEPVVLQCPHGMLTRGAGAEVRARHQDRAGGVDRLVEDEGRVGPPRGEQAVLEAGTGDP